ncbi:Gamma interferon inducible lysosomal thiol reductase (GILT) [Popillia japonica]|uniref:Gamma interferon inducible lysosomal thiol reductase (GILT) n=1 Tax=Popillia japonica TaxID=7064 RepID=A0AAW1KGV5_POPJA
MLKLSAFLLLLVLINLSEQKIRITILYESLCPDSSKFINEQLAPCYDSIKDNVDIEFVPYGKATHKNTTAGFKFECQHGPRECELNIHHACGIKYASSDSQKVKFVNCMMREATENNGNNAVTTCTKQTGISFDNVSRCYSGKEGQTLHAGHGDRTETFAPSFIPTILFNNTFDQYNQDRALNNLCSLVNELCLREAYKQLTYYNCNNYCCNCIPYNYQYNYPYGYYYG